MLALNIYFVFGCYFVMTPHLLAVLTFDLEMSGSHSREAATLPNGKHSYFYNEQHNKTSSLFSEAVNKVKLVQTSLQVSHTRNKRKRISLILLRSLLEFVNRKKHKFLWTRMTIHISILY